MPVNAVNAENTFSHRYSALATAFALAVLFAWDASGLDLALARLMSGAAGFPARDHLLLTTVLHEGARMLSGLMLLGLLLSVWRPWGVLARLSRSQRLWLLGTVASSMLLVSVAKRWSVTSCPWDLAGFGGQLPYVPHWLLGRTDGGPGHCFPAGHASAGFAWLAGWFAWPRGSRIGRRWLWAALSAGLVLGLAQQLRGAHFMSHTLWMAWLCWTWAWLLSALLPDSRVHHAPAAG